MKRGFSRWIPCHGLGPLVLLCHAALAGGESGLPGAGGSPDAPAITALRVEPTAGPAGTVYTLALRITDPQGARDIARRLYLLREKRELITLALNDEGSGPDAVEGDGIYSARDTVPSTAAPRTHVFEAAVLDRERHRSNVLRFAFTVLKGRPVLRTGLSPAH